MSLPPPVLLDGGLGLDIILVPVELSVFLDWFPCVGDGVALSLLEPPPYFCLRLFSSSLAKYANEHLSTKF